MPESLPAWASLVLSAVEFFLGAMAVALCAFVTLAVLQLCRIEGTPHPAPAGRRVFRTRSA
jgi:hypothetical protein